MTNREEKKRRDLGFWIYIYIYLFIFEIIENKEAKKNLGFIEEEAKVFVEGEFLWKKRSRNFSSDTKLM